MSGERIKGRKVGVGTSSSSSSGSVMFPFFTNMYSSATKAEQILSRYRPIAPKPPSAPKPDAADSSAAAAPAASAAAPAVQSSSSASIGCRKGTRKRAPGENLISPRSYKRSTGNHRKPQQQQAQQQQESKQQQMVPVMGAEMGVSLSSTVTTSVSEAPAPASARALREPVWKVLRRNPNPETSYEILSNSRSLSSSEFLYPSGNVQISSQASLSPSHLHQQQLQQHRNPLSIVKAEQHQQHRNPLSIVKGEQEQQQQQQEEQAEEEEEDRPKLVTLLLLPDTPAQVAESCAISTSDLRLRLHDENQLELSLFSGAASCSAPLRYSAGEGCTPPRYAAEQQQQRVPDFKQQHAGVIDSGYLEQAHGGSSDPVVLTSEGSSSSVLWSNLSYNKVMSERMSGKRAAGPYIDPLGLPTQLGCFRFRPRGTGSECSAVLWGFLKKFMLLDSNPQHAAGNMSGNSGEVVEQSSVFHQYQQRQQQQQQSSDQHLQNNCDERQQQQQVIVPQPRRPCGVGSAVCLEMVSEMNCYSGCLTGCLESVESQLERTSSPAFVTDRSNRVRWVNGAYHRLVASPPSCPSQHQPQPQHQQQREQRPNGYQHHQVGMMNGNCTTEESANSSSSACMADRDVVFQWERSPYSAVSLAGFARVDWLDCGKRCCLTGVPCEMRRLDDPRFGSLFVWKLNLNVDNVIRNRG